MLWGAAWLRRATGEDYYLTYLVNNRQAFGANFNYLEFGWDNKVGGLNVLIAKVWSNSIRSSSEIIKYDTLMVVINCNALYIDRKHTNILLCSQSIYSKLNL